MLFRLVHNLRLIHCFWNFLHVFGLWVTESEIVAKRENAEQPGCREQWLRVGTKRWLGSMG